MCLAVPGKIVALEGDRAVADMHGNRVRISTVLTPEAGLGDWVLVHAGFAIEKLNAEAAAETFAILQDVERAAEGPPEAGAASASAGEEVAHA